MAVADPSTNRDAPGDGCDGAPLRFRLVIAIVVIAVMVTTLAILIATHFNRSVFDAVPYNSDEYKNWSTARTFRAVHFDGGVYSINEIEPRTSISRFGAHGVIYPVLYGTLGRVFGWGVHSPLQMNVLLLSVSTILFFVLAQVRRTMLILSGIFLCTFTFLLIAQTVALQETMHQAAALILAGVCLRYREGRLMPVAGRIGLTVGLVAIASARPTWCALAAVLFFTTIAPEWSRWKRLLGSASMIALPIVLFLAMEPPVPTSPLGRAAGSAANPWSLIGAALTRLGESLRQATAFLRDEETWFMASQRVYMVVLLGGLIAALVMQRKALDRARPDVVLHVANLSFPLVANVMIANFGSGRDLRLFAPHILLSALVLCCSRPRWIGYLAVALNVVLLPAANTHVGVLAGVFQPVDTATVELRAGLERYVPYLPSSSKWCNTLLVAEPDLRAAFLAAPPGIGLSVYLPDRGPLLHPRSVYVLDGGSGISSALDFGGELKEIATIGEFKIWRNPSSACTIARNRVDR